MACALNGDAVEFEAEGFSVYMVVYTTLTQTLTAGDGNEYLVTVTYDSASGIPSDAALTVSEIVPNDAAYDEYVARSAAALGQTSKNVLFAKAFDIALTNPATGAEYQPNGDVTVSVRLLRENLNSYENVGVVHIADGARAGADVMDSTLRGEAVEFNTDGFSVYVLCGYTVDFHWGDYTYSIAGESGITLGDLFEVLGVTELTVADVADVSFSNPDYIGIERTDADWLLKSLAPFNSEEALTLTLRNGQSVRIKVTDENEEPVSSATPLTREYVALDGSWAYWKVTVNPKGYTLNGGRPLVLSDTFDDGIEMDAGQTIDYASVKVESSGAVTYDYSGNTGVFVIPDNTPATITYRTRVTAQPGEAALFRGTAVLRDTENNTIASATAGVTEEAVVIYPSPSDVGGLGDNYMLKLFVYADGAMQTGVSGAQFILLDANQRALEYKQGDNKGEPVTFTTGEDGHVNIELHEEAGDISIEKNTGYYLEMIQAVDGYQKDNTLYSFMITDDPAYSSGGFYKYFNGDTMKVRLYPASAGLSVSIRFSGSYAMSQEQQNAVTAVLQKWDETANDWVEVERHPYTDTAWGAIKFNEALHDETLGAFQNIYRVVEENQSPWDLPQDVNLETTYYCLVNSSGSDPHAQPQEFSVSSVGDSVSVVIDNRYEESQLTIVKMDKNTGKTLGGAEFTVYEIVDGEASGNAVKTYTTGDDGELVIRGGEPFEAEKLYGITETGAPAGYLLPLRQEWHYFYFCNDEYLEPSILANLPEDATAVNLTKSGDRITIDNQKAIVDIPVMKIWQGGTWPEDYEVVVGLYQSVEGGEAQAVLDGEGVPRTVTLTKASPYNSRAFAGLPSRDEQNRNIVYSIREESINGQNPLDVGYVQEYGVSSAGVYVVRNKPATTLTVSKEWYENDTKVTNEDVLAAQSSVTFDVYRSSVPIGEAVVADGITNAEMTAFASGLAKVRENLSFGAENGWTTSIRDLDKQDDLGNPYYYYVLETIPSFGNERYEVDVENCRVTIQNKIAPESVELTVTKAALKEDPRPESLERKFEFTLKLEADENHPIRSWQVYTDEQNPDNNLITDWNGEVRFRLKPTNPEQELTEGASIVLSLPVGVTATVTETYNPEYRVEKESSVTGAPADSGRIFRYATDGDAVTLTYTNTLRVICKVVDNEGNEKPFESLSSALKHIRENPTDFTAPWTIYLLEDYTIPATDVIQVKEGESLTLVTSPTGDEGGRFPFMPPEDEPDRSFAVITRGEAGGSMLKNDGALTLQNICLDGGNIESTEDGGLVNSSGTLNLNAGTTLRNSATVGKGGAVYAEGAVNIADTVAITGNSAPSASALYLRGTLNMTGGSITGNTGATDGAVVVDTAGDVINLSGSPVIFENTNAQGKAANLYIGVDSDSIVNVTNPGLSENAHIGVSAMEGHLLIGEQFATAEFGQTDNLNRFTNDVYGYRGKLKDGTTTNIVWNGLTLGIAKDVDSIGANADDRFTITLSSPSIMMSSYIIDGTQDYAVTPAGLNRPGRIVFRNVKAGDEYTISPLPVGSYTITEAASNYDPVYTQSVAGGAETAIEGGVFEALDDCTVTVTNARRLADINLTKTLEDRLKATDETQPFDFTINLTEADGTAVSGFTLAEGVVTNDSGAATLRLSPQNSAEGGETRAFRAPVGATMTITETNDPSYRITASAVTMPSEGEGEAIADEDTANDNVFAFPVTDSGAHVSFHNVRKMADITLSKELVGKVSKREDFEFTVTLTRADGVPAAGYVMYEDAEDPTKNITAGEDGSATIPFVFEENESAKSVTLTIPEGTKLEVAETEVKKDVNGTQRSIYNTARSLNGGAAQTGLKAEIASVSDSDSSIAFTNTRKTQTITVTNTVGGYSGNVVPFTFTATVTDGVGNDYDDNGFTDGVQTFELATGHSKVLTVPYGATLNVAESFIVGYDTTVKRGSAAAVEALSDTFVVTADVNPLLFTNSQLIGLRIVNNTSSTLENVKITVGKNNIYLVNEDQTGQERISSNKTATISVEAGKTAILEIQHDTSVTAEQNYTVSGTAPADGYYYTINNEPSFHEFADPAILRVYNTDSYVVKGKLRYSVNDSTVTFTEQPLVSFDSNGGSWTTEMDGYHDPDGNRKVYQKAVNSGETVARPTPDPVYPTAEGIAFLGWTTDETFAKQAHTESEDISAKLYDFENTLVTTPFTLYAIWARDPNVRTVTVKNGLDTTLTVTVTLTNDDPSGAYYTLYEDTVDSSNNITTDASGAATFTLAANETRNLHVPDGAKLVISGSGGIAYSSDYTDTDSVPGSFTIDSVQNDGTVSFIDGIFKITDAAGNLLYDANGRPTIYGNLRKTNNANPDEAFDAYEKTLYTDAAHTTPATPAAVKQLVDEYTIPNTAAIAFPNMTMTLTTAGKNDTNFPYVGVRDRATIYRSTAGANANCFTLTQAKSNITLTEIILDGGSEQGVKIAGTTSGGLVRVEAGSLNVTTGTTLRNCEFDNYSSTQYCRGGAIYVKGGTLNVSAGLFSNLHAQRGGAICCDNSGTLNVTGTAGSTRFENCIAENVADCDGGAIYYGVQKTLTINGGSDKDNPGIVFQSCVALGNNSTSDNGNKSSGGAIYAATSGKQPVSVSGCSFVECSARTTETGNAANGGGAICANNVSAFSASACQFTACDTLSRGGGVVVYVANGGEVSVNHSTFERCNCKGQGGGMAVYQPDQENSNVPKETDARALTKLSVNACDFSNCSSGTNNGSGGAIQCYLPRMEFTDSTFTDCWAGKEGGAVNNYFGNGYTVVWPGTYMNMTGCTFIRCRAEDRYQAEQPQHYGGAVNTKVKTVTVSKSYFEDCVSTLREGGALHLGGQGGGSKATITGSTFKNCTAKTCGGALLASTETLEVSNSFFYGCQTSGVPAANYVYNNNNKKNQNGGGAISHSENSRGTSTQKTTLITNCIFAADPNGGTDALSCSTATNGGAIWTRANTTVTVSGCTIDGCVANGNGGGVYLDAATRGVTISGEIVDNALHGSITGCQAVNGSAVYVGYSATFSGVSITGNACSNVNSGAIHGGTLYFEGSTVVKDNTCSSDSAYKHDVLLQNNNNTTIQTTAAGLANGANIGVYVADPNNAYANHGKEGQQFGTYGADNGNAILESFFNDRDDGLYGYGQGANGIYWGRYLCKITDAEGNTLKRANGRDAVYQRLTMALDEFITVEDENGETGKAKYIKMLVENYNIFQTAQISNFPEADVTLTTAGIDDVEHPYRGREGTVCTISRTNSTNALFSLGTAGATFKLENITLDGRKDKTTAQGDYRLIEATNGNLVVNAGTTMQYGYHTHSSDSYGGGAIYATGASVTVNGAYNAEDKSAGVQFLNCIVGGQNNGGAIWANNLTINLPSGNANQPGTVFIDCAAKRGGAICVNGSTTVIDGVLCKNCQSQTEGGAIYHLNASAESTTIKNSVFENCHSTNTDIKTWAYGGALHSKASVLTVEGCSFTDCSSVSNGGAIYHGDVNSNHVPNGSRGKTSISDSVFIGCKTINSESGFGSGGSVYTQAKEVEFVDCLIRNSTACDNGGALYCRSDIAESKTTISGTSFENCSSTRADGCGGAIYSKGKTLTLQNSAKGHTTFDACTAPGYSGAVYMETAGSTLNISGNTTISSCYAKRGGAIYLKSNATLNLTDSPEFTRNGYATLNGATVDAAQGACIYLAEGSRINLSGSPKFSRNILPNQARITNGGIYDNVRQDIYLAGYSGKEAASIHVVGALTGDTIWVWPEQSPHKMPNEQFAKISISVSSLSEEALADTLSHFRNALSDEVTGCTNGEYLAGVKVGDDTANVYWDKMYTISFRKIDNKGVAVPGAGFTLYKDSACTDAVATAVSANGESDTDAQGKLLSRGTVEFASIRIGAYYMKETQVPTSFKANDTTYLVLVGTPYLSPNQANTYLWAGNGPLNVDNAATLVAQQTTNVGKYYGIFPLDGNNKAILRGNLASSSAGIENVRNDYQVSFMKADGSGKPLPGAAFTVYTAIQGANGQPAVLEDGYPALMRWSRDGENYPAAVVSADGSTSFRDVNNGTLPKGLVYFRELPIGTYYLLETAFPERNGDGRRTYYAEEDRVFKLDIVEDGTAEDGIRVTLSEWVPGEGYSPLEKVDGYYVVTNREIVCKLTDASDNLLYVQGHRIWERNGDGPGTVRLFPAVYPTLEEGFAAAQNGTFVYANGKAADVSSLKLKVLKDFTMNAPVTYSSNDRALTFTTAETRARKEDRYVFSTTRTSDTSRAEIKRDYNDEALITVSDGARLTLQNIKLNGQKTSHDGRAIHVVKGSLTVLNNTQLLNFKQASGQGGAILLEENASLTVNGGSARSAIFSNNEVDGEADADGGAIAAGKNCSVSLANAQFIGNKADNGNGGAFSVDAQGEDAQEISLVNVVLRSNTAGSGGAVSAGENANLTVENSTFTSNAASEDGGAVRIGGNGALTLKGGTFTGNKAQRGGTVYVAPAASATISNGTYRSNTANANGGAVYVAAAQGEGDGEARIGTLTLEGGSLTGNSAALGSAVYAEDHGAVSLSGGSVTGNEASGTNGGAINVGGENARLYFTGSPVVFNNTDANGTKSPQRNVVLDVDSNEVIRTGEAGLAGGVVGVYVIDGEGGDIFNRHGIMDTPFGTFGDGAHANPDVFINDRNLALRGVSKSSDDNKIYWDEVVCKLTDSDDTLLYKAVAINVNGVRTTLYAPAVYKTLEEGFEASKGTLYYMDGRQFTGDSLKVKMLRDYPLKEKHDTPVGRAVTLTTAETAIDPSKTENDGDTLTFSTKREEDRERAHITRDFEGNSMFAVNRGSDLTVADIVLDGDKANHSATGDGGIAHVGDGGALTVTEGATLTHAKAKGNGGAIYAASGATVTMTGGEISHNEAIAGGAGIYLAEGSVLKLKGDPSFDDNTVTDAENYPGNPPRTNGGQEVYTDGKLRQDIFIAGYFGKVSAAESAAAKPATSIVVTGDITSGAGSIWVWAEKPDEDQPDNHYETLKQFAVVESGKTISAASYTAFRNAQHDGVTLCGAEYLTGEAGEAMTDAAGTTWKTIRWKGGGFDFSFKKIDGFGAPLPYAKFTLYRSYAFEMASKAQTLTETLAKGEATSSDGTAENSKGETIAKGDVLFEKVPQGIHFMLESGVPDGYLKTTEDAESPVIYTRDSADTEPVKAVGVGPTVYVVLLGEAALSRPVDTAGTPWADVLADITEEHIRMQTGEGAEARNYAIFKIDPDTGRAVATPDIATYGILNVSAARRKVILRKVEENTYKPLENAAFEILRYDRTQVSGMDVNGNTVTSFTSLSNGAYFIDMLPYGTYYLHETRDASEQVANIWFILTVNENGAGYKTAEAGIINALKPETQTP